MKKKIDQIKKIIKEITESKMINNQDHLNNDLKIDSLDMIEIIMALEEKFNIEIPDEIIEQFDTVQSIINYITKIKK